MTGPAELLLQSSNPFIRWEWIDRNRDLIWERTVEHVELTALAVGVGLLVALPFALLARRFRSAHAPVLVAAGALYSVPSLAAFGLLIPLTGLSRATAVIPLASYTLLILIRNLVAGLESVPPAILEAATGVGYSAPRRLAAIEFPMAIPAIIAGIRIATVTTIGLVTVAAVVGQGGLGRFIVDGYSRDFTTPLHVGMVISIALAVAADLLLLGVERVLTPWTRRGR